jgi:5'-nucleotidase / UDP-sugar diphosphatase
MPEKILGTRMLWGLSMRSEIIGVYILMAFLFCLSTSASLKASTKELVLLHTNDMHARVMGVRHDDSMCSLEDRDSVACFGGFDRIASQVNYERSMHQNILLVDAGDQFQGTMFHLMYHGQVSAQMMNLIGYEAMAVGNHEFDNGTKTLASFIKTIKFPILSANIDASKSPELKNRIKPYVIVRKNGLRIGILGYTTEDTAYLSSPGADIKFLPIIDSVKKAVLALKKAHADVIIAVSHSGLNQDIEVAKNVSGLAAIISGHTNSLLSNRQQKADGPSPLVVMSQDHAPVLLVSAYAYGKYLGKLRFSFDDKGRPTAWDGEPILLDHAIKPDDVIRGEIDKYYQPIKALQNQTVGFTPVDIDGQSCRFQECTFGNLLADSMLEHAKPFGVDIALMNGGGIRASAGKGPITYAGLQDVLPFDKTLVLYRLKGLVIKDALEHGVAYVEDQKNGNTGRFLQVAGLRYSFDPKKPRGKRIADVFVKNGLHQWVRLDLKKTYGVVTNSYMAGGGDNYTQFFGHKERWSIALELKDLLSQFFQSSLSQLPKRDGRIINLAQACMGPNPSCALVFYSLISGS